MWRYVLSLEMYAKAYKDIEPKRAKVKFLNEKLLKSQEELRTLKENQEALKNALDSLKTNL